MDFSPDKLRARFAELTKQYNAMDAKRAPLQQERDKKHASLTTKQLQVYDDKIRKANKGMYEVEMERAMIARALGGKTS